MNLRRYSRRAKYAVATAFARLVLFAVKRMRYRHVCRVAGWAGAALTAVPPAKRLVRANLEVAFPDMAPDRLRGLCRENLRNLCLFGFEFAWFSAHPEGIKEAVSYGSEAARQAIQEAVEGQPVMMLTPHVGNWELAAQFACIQGVRLCAVARPSQSTGIERLLRERRSVNGLEIIDQGGAVKAIVKALRAGKSVGILMDQNLKVRKGGVFVEFFGLPVTTTRAPASLARRLGVKVACFACIRKSDGFEIHVKQLPRPIADYADDIDLTQDMLALNEQFAAEHPEQYLWLYERWRSAPPGLDRHKLQRYPYYLKLPA